MRTQFYVTDLAPNGTGSVVIIDRNGDEHVIDEAVFGLMPKTKPVEITMAWDAEPWTVYKTSLNAILRHIACSPVSDGSQVVAEIRKVLGK